MVHIHFLLIFVSLAHTLYCAQAPQPKPTKLDQAITQRSKELDDEKKRVAAFEQLQHKNLQTELEKVAKKQEELDTLHADKINLESAQKLASAHRKKALELVGVVKGQCDCWHTVKTQHDANACAMQRSTSLLFSEHIRVFSQAAAVQHTILAKHKDKLESSVTLPKNLSAITDTPQLLMALQDGAAKMVTADDAQIVIAIEKRLIDVASNSTPFIPDAQALEQAHQKCGACAVHNARWVKLKLNLKKLFAKWQQDIITLIEEA
jgi:hypothetical protein